ncbi:hypothetical protein [Actinomadura harenae]|nr:hypothetical protein [Actinomadura harenae]
MSHRLGAYPSLTMPPGPEPQEAELARLLELNQRLHSIARANQETDQT